MTPLLPAIVATFVSSLLLCLIYLYLYLQERDKSLLIWTIAWGIYSLRFLFRLLLTFSASSPLLGFANQINALLFSLFLLWGAFLWAEKKMKRSWFVATAAGAVWITIASYIQADFLWLTLPTFVFIGTVSIWTGIVFIRSKRGSGFGALLTGWVLILWGLHKMDYPFLQPIAWFAPWGYMLGAIFAIATAIGMLLLYFEKTRESLAQSERLYRAIAEDTPVLICRCLPNGELTYVNHAYSQYFGHASAKLTGQSIYTFIPEEAQETVRNNIAMLSSDFPIQSHEHEVLSASGETRWVHWTNRGLFDAAGNVIGFQSIGDDVTQRVRAERDLADSQAILQGLVEQSPVPMAIVRPDGSISYNKASVDYLSLGDESVAHQGMQFEDLAQDWQYFDAEGNALSLDVLPLALALQGQTTKGRELRVVRKDGSEVWEIATAAPIYGDGGQLIAAFVMFPDITALKEAGSALRSSEERLRIFLQQAGDAMYVADMGGAIIEVNAQACRATGYTEKELLSLRLEDVDVEMSSTDKVKKFLSSLLPGAPTVLETRQRRKDGSVFSVELSVSRLDTPDGPCVLVMARDISERRRDERVRAAELRLIEYSAQHTVKGLLQGFLDEAEMLTGSEVGFYHFVEEDQETLSLQAWSTNTLENMCTAEGEGLHYAISEAGVWVDSVREGGPVIHNDYASLPHKRGLPEGHAPVIRELVVPVLRYDRIAAILGVGNKPTAYDEEDVKAVQRLADLAWETVIRKRAEEALRDSQERLLKLANVTTDLIYEWDLATDTLDWYGDIDAALGYDQGEVAHTVAGWLDLLHPDDSGRLADMVEENRTSVEPFRETYRVRRKDGTWAWWDAVGTPIVDDQGRPVRCLGGCRDVSRERALEEQYRQAQKMEAIGQLTGGVAHDFNNLLQVINGCTDMAIEDLEQGHPSLESMAEVAKAGQRAARLVSQLLLFSRRQIMRPEVFDLNDAVADMLKMLGRIIGEHVELRWHPGAPAGSVQADRGMVEQALVNLCVNARDAMPDGGTLVIETQDVMIDEDYCSSHSWAEPGHYTLLSISDTGCGMDQKTLAHIFEPFFTTKETGRGTGLGLATVYGIIKQHDGMINVCSEPGQGTVFKLYWPRCDKSSSVDDTTGDIEALGGNETILLVEDDASVRRIARVILERAGYRVYEAGDGSEALAMFDRQSDAIDLVILDVVMPAMGGREAYDRMCAVRPDLNALFASGYSEDAIHNNFVLEAGLTLLQKPFLATELLQAVRKILEEGGA